MSHETSAPPAIVLARPQLGENIGAAARVMANFGLADLRLVAPRDGWPNPKAEAMGAGVLDGIVSATIFDTVPDALSDCRFVLAATARPRELDLPVLGPRAALARCHDEAGASLQTAILFGAEASGLNNDEIVLADAIVTYPVAEAFTSLNLAQSVAVAAYEWRAGVSDTPPARFERDAPAPASKDEIAGLADHLDRELDTAGFFFPPERVETMKRNMRAIVTRGGWTSQDVQTLRGAVKALAEGPRRRSLEKE